MPSAFAHAAAGLAIAATLRPAELPRRFWVAAALCATIPDIDALGRPFGVLDYETAFGGHRGFTHSLLFAALFGAGVAWAVSQAPSGKGARLRLWLCFALATASHGILDGLTTTGDGVKYFSPFVDERFTFLWHPIDPRSAAAGVRAPLLRILYLMGSEILWVGVPCAALVAISYAVRERRRHPGKPAR